MHQRPEEETCDFHTEGRGKEEQLQLQSLLDFVEHSLATQSDQQIMATKQKMVERLNKAVSKKLHAKCNPLEDVEIKFKKDVTVLEHCKNLGMVDCSFLHSAPFSTIRRQRKLL